MPDHVTLLYFPLLQSQGKYGKIEEGDTMGTKRKVKIELNAKEEALVHYESEWGRNESIKRAARILHYANIGTETMRELCEKTGYDFETVSRMLKLYQTMGVDAIYQCRRGKRINHLEQISDELNESVSTVKRRHKSALENVVLPENMISI